MEKEKKYPVKVTVDIGKLTISCANQTGDAKEEIYVSTEGKNIEAGFNPKYFLDSLKAIVSDYMEKTEGVTVNTNNVFFKVGRRSVGYGISEHEELVFIGCDVIAIGEGN